MIDKRSELRDKLMVAILDLTDSCNSCQTITERVNIYNLLMQDSRVAYNYL
jgi:hypothetical protein